MFFPPTEEYVNDTFWNVKEYYWIVTDDMKLEENQLLWKLNHLLNWWQNYKGSTVDSEHSQKMPAWLRTLNATKLLQNNCADNKKPFISLPYA